MHVSHDIHGTLITFLCWRLLFCCFFFCKWVRYVLHLIVDLLRIIIIVLCCNKLFSHFYLKCQLLIDLCLSRTCTFIARWSRVVPNEPSQSAIISRRQRLHVWRLDIRIRSIARGLVWSRSQSHVVTVVQWKVNVCMCL